MVRIGDRNGKGGGRGGRGAGGKGAARGKELQAWRPDKNPNRKVRVFLSHKGEDRAHARKLVEEMEAAGAGRLDVFVSESIPFGKEWQKELTSKLRLADWLILLYTEPGRNWDWCLYECGYFRGHRDGAKNRSGKLYVLRAASGQGPEPLKVFQSMGATADDADKLLKELFLKAPWPGARPVNPTLKPNTAQWAALRGLLTVVGPHPIPAPRHLLDELTVRIPAAAEGALSRTGRLPDESVLQGDDGVMEILGLDAKAEGYTWAEMRRAYGIDREQDEEAGVGIVATVAANAAAAAAGAGEGGGGQAGQAGTLEEEVVARVRKARMAEWFRVLGQRLRETLSPTIMEATLPMLRQYRHEPPVVYAAAIRLAEHRGTDRSFQAHVVFMRIPPEVEAWPEGELGRVTHLLMLGRMCRYGILVPARQKLQEMERGTGAGLKRLVESVRLQFDLVQADSANRGIKTQDQAEAAFTVEERRKLAPLFTRWRDAQVKLNEIGSSGRCRVEDFAAVLEEMLSVNARFFEIAADRLRDLVYAAGGGGNGRGNGGGGGTWLRDRRRGEGGGPAGDGWGAKASERVGRREGRPTRQR